MSRIAHTLTWLGMTLARSQWRRKLMVAAPAILGFTVLGPFATYLEIAPLPRLLYWALELLGIGAFMHLAIWPLLNLPALVNWPRLLIVVLGAAIAAVPGCGVIYALEGVFRGTTLNTLAPVGLWAMVVMVGTMIASIEFAPEIFGPNRLRAPHDPSTVPAPLRRTLISLSQQDHYIAITSTDGTDLVRMRFADALAAVDAVPGARIHRSHWIAATALVAVARQGHRYVAALSDGRTLPISRPYLRQVRTLLARDTGAATGAIA